MLGESRERVLATLPDDALVLDVGGWAQPFERADWVIDLLPHDGRGIYGYGDEQRAQERFTAATWIQRDICDREPWPFADDQFDFVICSHTLEDVRDPVWASHELARVARAGYVEVPSRREEQSLGVHGPWPGWSHHHWLIDIDESAARIEFVFKPHVLGSRDSDVFTPEWHRSLTEHQRVQHLWWEGGFEAVERIFTDSAPLDAYLREYVDAHRDDVVAGPAGSPERGRLGRLLRG
jgi:hypothetical protein